MQRQCFPESVAGMICVVSVTSMQHRCVDLLAAYEPMRHNNTKDDEVLQPSFRIVQQCWDL